MVSYIPDRCDIIWLDFNPQKGREIQKRRPALIISPKSYNKKTFLSLCMPITSQLKGYPFEVTFSLKEIQGAVLSDQMRSLDWKARNAAFITKLPNPLFLEAVSKFKTLVD